MNAIAMESIEQLQQRIDYELARQNYPENFPPLPDLPAERYVSQEFYDLERKYLWTRSWLYAAHKDQFPQVGSYVVFDSVPGMPVVIVRDEDCYRAFYNTCSHRGGCLVKERQGVCAGKRLICGYHSWTYDFNGKLVGITDSVDFFNVDKSKRGLTKLRCESWCGFIFINGNLDAQPLADHLGTVRAQMAQFNPDKLALISRYHYDCACNWKVLMDAFAENYHFVSVHRGTVGLPGPNCAVRHRGTVMSLYKNGNSRNILPWNDGFEPRESAAEDTGFSMGMGGIEDIPSVGPIPRKFITAFTSFPNLTTPVYANGFPLLLFWPTGLNTSRLEVVWFGLPHGGDELPTAWKEKIAAFNVVLDEDLTFLPSVQTSAESPVFRSIVLSYQERRIYHAHEEIDRTIGPERIPERLRVKQVLGPQVEA
jgi:phenylpropionate dioxygenase-like ring-hydroxylating dioxygenase large terminal subunit